MIKIVFNIIFLNNINFKYIYIYACVKCYLFLIIYIFIIKMVYNFKYINALHKLNANFKNEYSKQSIASLVEKK